MNKIASVLLCTIALTACQKKQTAESPAAPVANADAAKAAPAAQTANKPVYRVGVEIDAPFAFSEADGSMGGFDIEVLKAIGERQGFDLEFKSYPWASLFNAVEHGQADLTAGGIYVTTERQERFDFSNGYLSTGTSMWVQNSSGVKLLEDIRGKTVAFKGRTQAERWTKHTVGQQDDKLLRKDTLWLAFKEGASKRVDVVIGDTASLMYFSKKYPAPGMSLIQVTSLPTEQYAFMIRKGQPELLEKLNTGLTQLQQDGTLERLRQKWFENVKP